MPPGSDARISLLIDQLTALLEPIVADHGCELVELQFRRETRGWILRLIVDKEGGVSLDDCAAISREAGHLLEVEDPIEQSYHLEVSSPGLDRPLKRARDFSRCVGRKAKVTTKEPLDGEHQFVGVIEDFDGEKLVLLAGKGTVVIPFAQIAKARLVVEI